MTQFASEFAREIVVELCRAAVILALVFFPILGVSGYVAVVLLGQGPVVMGLLAGVLLWIVFDPIEATLEDYGVFAAEESGSS